MRFSELEEITGGTSNIINDNEVRKFSTDTRTLIGSPDEVFIAINAKRDGHDFIDTAIKLGVSNFIVEKETAKNGTNSIEVESSISALQAIARQHRSNFSIPVVGITGSNGKTTVKEWLSTILSQRFYVVKSPKSYNSQIGVPLSILEIQSSHEIGVFEAGISLRNEMSNLKQVIQPSIGIFTTLGEAHDDGFESMEEKLAEKLKLFTNSEKIICRSDVPWVQQLRKHLHGKQLITWALDGSGEINVEWNQDSLIVDSHTFKTQLSSTAELENITHAIISAITLGLNAKKIQYGIDLIKSVPMRLELKKGIEGCYVLNDTYNNDLAGLRTAIDYIGDQRPNLKKTLILSDILHSGKPNDELYDEVATILREKKYNRLIGVGENISESKDLFDIESQFFDSTEALANDFPNFKNEMILVKGARDFELEKVVNLLEERNHGTVLEINLEALKHNLNQYKSLLSKETQLMVMVKANAYGSGLLEVSNFLQHEKVDRLGVAYVDEAIQLRQNGITLPIMIMNPHIESFSQFERFNLEPEIFSLSYLDQLIKDTSIPPPIHIKVDTGMHRLGFTEDQIPSLIQTLNDNPSIKVASIFTHFSSSENSDDDPFTITQAQVFDKVFGQIQEALGYTPLKHACNSPAMVRWPQYHYDMVRLGIGLYGYDPTQTLQLKSTNELKTIVSQIQTLQKGETVGYSRKGKLKRDSKIAILPIGYEDGYLRAFGNGNISVSINDQLFPTIGNVCMDMVMIDVTDADVKEGDQVVIFGNSPKITDLARVANTIPYEILTNVSSRVKRIFVSE